jgi:hypothetical protein
MGEVPGDEASNDSGEDREADHGPERAEVKGGKEHGVDESTKEVSTDNTTNANTNPGGLEHEPGGKQSKGQGNSEANGKSSGGLHPSKDRYEHQEGAGGKDESNTGSHPGETALTAESDNRAADKHDESENPRVLSNKGSEAEAVNSGTAGVVGNDNLEVARISFVVGGKDLGSALTNDALVALNFSGEAIVDSFARCVVFAPGIRVLSESDRRLIAILVGCGVGGDHITVGVGVDKVSGQTSLLDVSERGNIRIFVAG